MLALWHRILTILCLTIPLASFAQTHNTVEDTLVVDTIQTESLSVDSTQIEDTIADILGKYKQTLDQTTSQFQSWKYEKNDTLSNPDYFRLFMTPTLYNHVTNEWIGRKSLSNEKTTIRKTRKRNIEALLIDLYVHHPEYVVLLEREEKREGRPKQNQSQEIKPVAVPKIVKKTEKPAMEDQNEWGELWEVEVKRPNFWKLSANTSLHFTQNYISNNWYKGGESNSSLLASIILDANFDNKQKLIFNNKLEMKLGFQTSKDDSERLLRTNSDLIRMTNKLGWKAAKNWYYTTTLQTWTQFHPAYKKNDSKVYSDFMSPFESLLTVGMDFSFSKKKGNLNLSLSPLACNFKYVDRLALAPSFGLPEGKHSKFNLGSNVTVNYKWNIWKNLSWQGRVYYFTDYHRTQIEWENTFKLQVNKYLSTSIFLYPRFDDGVTRQEGKSYFQFHELLSVGFDYTF
jgi:hypothetical protein